MGFESVFSGRSLGRFSLATGIVVVLAGLSLWAGTATAVAEPTPSWLRAPVLPDLEGKVERRLIHDLSSGRDRRMRARVFAKVGDSNTQLTGVLYGFGCRRAELGGSTGLAKVIRRYRQVRLANPRPVVGCEAGNSFSRRSAAVASGSTSSWSLTPVSALSPDDAQARSAECRTGETLLSCELRVTRPRYTFVMTGSNDITLDFLWAGITPASRLQVRLAPVIRTIRRFGSVPVLSTVAPVPRGPLAWQYIGDTNREVWRLARRLNVPLINLYRALNSPTMVNHGIAEDDAHLAIYGNEGASRVEVPGPTTLRDSVNLTRPALRYGANRRNLIILKTLRRLDRTARGGPR